MRHLTWSSVAVATLILFSASPSAQTPTTAAISGFAADEQGGRLPSVTILLTDESTGARNQTTTDEAGRFRIVNLRVGGPYTFTAARSGFADQTERDVQLALGEDRRFAVTLRLAAVNEIVVVTAPASSLLDPTHAGTGDRVSSGTIERMPVVRRSIVELARLSPHVNSNGPGQSIGEAVMSIAGRNSRYNNLEIDGSVHNDLFGLSPTGAPGGGANAQPISLDAVQELQLVVAPYDVRQGGFSGGGLNIITKSGSNRLAGTAYLFTRGASDVGVIPSLLTPTIDTRVGEFSDRQSGFTLGGRLVRDRAFLFGGFEANRRSIPSGFSISGDGGQKWGNEASVREVLSYLESQYGLQSGSVDQFIRPADSDNLFARIDLNLRSPNRLIGRVNHLDSHTVSGGSNNTVYVMPSALGQVADSTTSTVAQLNTVKGSVFNELRGAWQRLRLVRSPLDGFAPFPQVRVNLPEGGTLVTGSDGTAQANALDQDVIELSDDVSWARGGHSFSVGTHNEFFRFDNLFIQNLYGGYTFSSLANLQAGVAQAFTRNFSNTSDPLQSARFSVAQVGLYAGDQWRLGSRLTLTYGVRVDVPRLSDAPRANPLALSTFGLATDVVPAPAMWSPRAGFTWSIDGANAGVSQLRGGAGLFAGRPPYVWLSNQFLNNGLELTSLSVPQSPANRVPFVADPLRQPTDLGVGLQSLNLIDPGFAYPQVVRGNLAYDRDLRRWGWRLTAELLMSKTIRDVAFSNVNLIESGQLADGRPTYVRKSPAVNDAILIANTSQGSQWSATLRVERPFARRYGYSASYLYNASNSVNDGSAQLAVNNWTNTVTGGDVNNPPLTRSIYAVGHRINLAGMVEVPFFWRLKGTVSAFYNGQSGQPYSLVFLNSDANGDGRFNDIPLVPASAGDVIVRNGSWEQLDAFLRNDSSARDYRGRIPPRNSGTSPWINGLDARFAVTIPAGHRASVELSADLVNVFNLLNPRWGHARYPGTNVATVFGYAGVDAATGKPIYNLAALTAPTFTGAFQRDDLRSRWQARWGARVRF